MSPPPFGAPFIGKTICSSVVFPNCKFDSFSPISFQSYGGPCAPNHQQPILLCLFVSPWLMDTHHKKTATKNNLPCSQTYVNVMALRLSVSLTTCLSVIFQLILCMKTFLFSTSPSFCAIVIFILTLNCCTAHLLIHNLWTLSSCSSKR